jgi:predicted RNase H-like HicB family nuclease
MLVYNYAIEIFSGDDEGYIAVVPKTARLLSIWRECEEQALPEIKTAIDLWLSTARSTEREIQKAPGQENKNHAAGLVTIAGNGLGNASRRSWNGGRRE